jgi:hypothetical protein
MLYIAYGDRKFCYIFINQTVILQSIIDNNNNNNNFIGLVQSIVTINTLNTWYKNPLESGITRVFT